MMIEQIKRWFFYKEFNKKDGSPDTPGGVNLQQSIGILFDGTDEENRKIVYKFKDNLNPKGIKEIKSLTFLNNALPLDNVDYAAYNHKTIKWYGTPYGDKIDEFINTKFDILIVLCQHMLPHFEYIIAHSHAQFTVGPLMDHAEKYFDLTVDTQQSNDIQNIIHKIVSAVQLVAIK
ncbi:MAG: hypothetical protein WAU01_04255 [Saprospiraceae bacterium]